MIPVQIERSDVYPEQLDQELRDAGVDNYVRLDFGEDSISMLFEDGAGDQDFAAANAVVAAHVSTQHIVNAMDSAAKFGARMIREYQIRMISEGITQSAVMHEVAVALTTSTVLASHGSLVALDAELATLTPVPVFLEAARITEMRNRVRAHIGLPPV